DKTAPLHCPREALAKRRVVVDDEQRALAFGQPAQRRRLGFGTRAVLGSVDCVHAGCLAFPCDPSPPPISFAAANGRASASRLARCQEMTTWAPPSARLSKTSRAPSGAPVVAKMRRTRRSW